MDGDPLNRQEDLKEELAELRRVHSALLNRYEELKNCLAETGNDGSLKETLAHTERYLRSIIDAEPACVKLLDCEGILLDMNPAGLRMVEVEDRLRVLGQRVADLVVPEHRQAFEDLTRRVCQGEKGVLQFKMVGVQGTERWLESHAVPFFDEKAKRTLLLSVTRDITQEKIAEQSLRESEERYRMAVEYSNDGFALLRAGELEFCNPRFLDIFGYGGREEIEEMPFVEFIHPDDRDRLASVLDALGEPGGSPRQGEFRGIRTNGTTLELELSVTTVHHRGSLAGFVHVRDLSGRVEAEQQKLRVRNLESLGVLAGGIAHDFNNLLTSVFGNIELARMHSNPAAKTFDLLMESEQALVRAQHLTRQLLTFAKGGSPVREAVSLKTLLRQSVSFVLSGSKVQARFSIPDDLWAADVDPVQIEEVIHNVARNAREAMPAGGNFTVRAENLEVGAKGPLPLGEGRYVKIDFTDDGPGIPERSLSRVFDPYYTTKPLGVERGGGLGLSICHSIVSRHHGYMDVASVLGEGTSFRVYLPAIIEETPSDDQPLASGGKQGAEMARGRILVLEDEDAVIQVAGEVLEYLGYDAVFRHVGEDVVDEYVRARQEGAPFSLVILDLTIRGGMGGKETIENLKAVDPDVRAIVSSGYVDDDVMAHYEQHGFRAAVSKPFRIATLQEAIARAMKASNDETGDRA